MASAASSWAWQEWSAPWELSNVSVWDNWIMNILKPWGQCWTSCGVPNCSVFPFAAAQKEAVFLNSERAGQDGPREENFWGLGTKIQSGTHKCPWAEPPAHLNCPRFGSFSCLGSWLKDDQCQLPPHSRCAGMGWESSSENCLVKKSVLLLVLWIQAGLRMQGTLPSGVRMWPSSRVPCPTPCAPRWSLRSLPTQAMLGSYERLQPGPTRVETGSGVWKRSSHTAWNYCKGQRSSRKEIFIAQHEPILSHPFGLSPRSFHILTQNAATMLEESFYSLCLALSTQNFVVWCYCVCMCIFTPVHGCVHLSGELHKPCSFTHLPLYRVFIDWWRLSKHSSFPCTEFVLYLFISCCICASSDSSCLVLSLSVAVVVNYLAWKDWGPNLWHDDTQ